VTRKRKKNSECSNGNMPVYCHYDKEIKLCRECWPCQECDPCASCRLGTCLFGRKGGSA